MTSPWTVLQNIAEKRIEEALEKGELDNLPGMGKPLELEDLSQIPKEMRMAYKVLKNSGHLPPEVEDRKEAANILALLENCPDEQERIRQMTRLKIITTRIGHSLADNPLLEEHDEYYQLLLAKLHSLK